MDYLDALGLIAGTMTTVSFLPQVLRIWRTRSAMDISLVMYLFMTTGLFLWLVYGLCLGAMPIIVSNAVALLLALMVIAMKLKFG